MTHRCRGGRSARAFADAVIQRLGERPATLRAAAFARRPLHLSAWTPRPARRKEMVGIDVFVHARGIAPHWRCAEALAVTYPRC